MPINRKIRIGRVSSDKMQKTLVVVVGWKQRHPKYKKLIRRRSKFYVHDEDGQAKMGDLVRIRETRPLSSLKRWRLVEVLQKVDTVEARPEDIAEVELRALEEEPPVSSELTGAVEEAPDDSDVQQAKSS